MALKLPTADDSGGLGTGEADYGAFLSLRQRIETIKVSLMGGYIKIGDPPLLNYRDIRLYGVGVSRGWGATELFASFEGKTAVITGAKNSREVHIGLFHILSADYAVKASTFLGLNDGGPGFGLDLGFVRWF
jgi:hypothetical protein